MDAFLSASLSYPAVIYTALLGVMLIYWVMVIVGAVGVDLLGTGHGDVGHDVDLGDALDAPSVLSLRQVPLTVALSVLFFWNWLLCHLGSHYLLPLVAGFFGTAAGGTVLLLVAFVVAYALTKICIAPLAPLFRTHEAVRHRDLVGRVITVRTGEVTDRFGQGLLDEGGLELLLEVRCDPEKKLARGQRVLIISHDEAANAFDVEPVDELIVGKREL